MSPSFLWHKELMEIMLEAVRLCTHEIAKNASPGNAKVKDSLHKYEWTQKYLTERMPAEHQHSSITLDAEVIAIIKGAMLYYSQALAATRAHVKKTATVQEGATEEIDTKIQRIDDFVRGSGISDIPADQTLRPPAEAAAIAVDREPIITDEELVKTVRGLVDADDATNDRAINDACLVLETRLRNLSGFDKTYFGRRLIDKALRPADGRLLMGDTEPEKDGWWRLYDGFLQAFRNSTGHRRVAASRARAAQIIGMADYLICQLQESKRRDASGSK